MTDSNRQMVAELPKLPARWPESHKGDFGRVLVVAGSRGMAGAACLAGAAALRGGAGLVRVATATSALATVAAFEPSYLTYPLPDDSDGRISVAALPDLVELIRANDVLAIGPGLGQAPGVSQTVKGLLTSLKNVAVFDADAINALEGRAEHLSAVPGRVILTPHPGEFARLTGTDTETVQANRAEVAGEFAAQHGCILVLKGHRTVVTDGDHVYVNRTGNPGMATGGSGDVLTGLIAAFAAQAMRPFDAAVLGTHVHGLAGDLAASELGFTALIARDLLQYLPVALRTIETHKADEKDAKKSDG